MTETEIALRLTDRAWRSLLRDPSLRPAVPAQQRLRAIYFDTPSQELGANGMGLRLRREGRAWVQTLKWMGSRPTGAGGAWGAGGAIAPMGVSPLQRHELSHPVAGGSALVPPPLDAHALQAWSARGPGPGPGDSPQVPRIWVSADTASALGLPVKKDAGAVRVSLESLLPLLRPQFESQVVRRRFLCSTDGGLLEFSFDQGELCLPSGQQSSATSGPRPLQELEIELLEGLPRALWQKATEIVHAHPGEATIEPRSKAERGANLGPVGSAFRIPKALRPAALPSRVAAAEATVADALAVALSEGYAKIARAAVVVQESDAPAGPHQLRVSVRRLRSVLKLVTPLLESELWQEIIHDLRWIAAAAGPLRDRDVLSTDVLQPLTAALPNDAALAWAMACLDDSRALARASLRQDLRSARFQRLLLNLGQSAGLSMPQLANLHATDFAEVQMRRLKKKIRRREKAVGPDGQGLHELRLAHKAMRYGAAWLGAIDPKGRLGADAAALRCKSKEIQEALGSAQDALVGLPLLEEVLAKSGASGPGRGGYADRALALVQGWLLSRQTSRQTARPPE